jgi:uncharacterized phage protein (TIGR01671 family)
MKEIWFRGKRKDNGEWVEGYYGEFHNRPVLQEENSCQIFEPREDAYLLGSCVGGLWHIIDRETVGQFIGIRDKHSVKIFEGDIVRFHFARGEGKWIGEVKYDDHNGLVVFVGFMPCRYDSRNPAPFEVQVSSRDKSKFEVIGNRYDNPEYLGEDVYERLLVQR